MSRLGRASVALLLAAACAPAEPGWSSGHAADPAARVGSEAPVAEVLRGDPPPAAAVEPGGHAHHREEPEPADEGGHGEDHDAM